MEESTAFILALVGLFTGITAGFFGIGGGEIVVPSAIFAHFSYSHAVGISLMQMLFSSVVGSIINYKKGLLDLREGSFAALGGLMGAILGSFILKIIDDKILMGVFVVVVCYTFIKYAFSSNKKPEHFEEMHFDLHANNKTPEKKRAIPFVSMDRTHGVL
ncbi:sulfite exporter TauE/SafE family protein, partial [Helicobacter pylori]